MSGNSKIWGIVALSVGIAIAGCIWGLPKYQDYAHRQERQAKIAAMETAMAEKQYDVATSKASDLLWRESYRFTYEKGREIEAERAKIVDVLKRCAMEHQSLDACRTCLSNRKLFTNIAELEELKLFLEFKEKKTAENAIKYLEAYPNGKYTDELAGSFRERMSKAYTLEFPDAQPPKDSGAFYCQLVSTPLKNLGGYFKFNFRSEKMGLLPANTLSIRVKYTMGKQSVYSDDAHYSKTYIADATVDLEIKLVEMSTKKILWSHSATASEPAPYAVKFNKSNFNWDTDQDAINTLAMEKAGRKFEETLPKQQQ